MERPDRKVLTGAVGIGIPSGVILAWAIGLTGIEVPAEVATAFGGLISAIAAYFVPQR